MRLQNDSQKFALIRYRINFRNYGIPLGLQFFSLEVRLNSIYGMYARSGNYRINLVLLRDLP